jgi:phosphoribosylamine--glycine ligase
MAAPQSSAHGCIASFRPERLAGGLFPMKILVLGSGGREHALAWKLAQSPRVTQIFCAPGNGGIASIATCVPIKIHDHGALIEFARSEGIGLTVVGPDDALAAGIVDDFEAAGLRIFGPGRNAARLESSKAFAKDFMIRHGLPCARSATFDDPAEAQHYAQRLGVPVVIKADGLALGKGVLICRSSWESGLAIHRMMTERIFGEAGKRVVIEEFLEGEECSIHALVDGRSFLLFPGAQDHKRALDGDEGLNTGGMGTFSPPSHLLDAEMDKRIREEILAPFIAGIQRDGLDFRGMLFPGLMITREGPRLLEFNCRFGDPETQVLLALMESDLLDLLEATLDQRLASMQPVWKRGAAVCVVLASGGYPASYTTGEPISGLDTLPPEITIFHAGTRLAEHGLATSGGRVLGVTACGPDLASARAAAYEAVGRIHFARMHYRRDIGAKGIPR